MQRGLVVTKLYILLEDISKKIRLNHKVNDISLDVNAISYYCLYLLIEEKNLRVCIIDSRNQKCILLEDYRFSTINTIDDLLQHLTALYDGHVVLKAGFWKKIVLGVRNESFVFVPNELFDGNQAEAYLNYNTFHKSEEYQAVYYQHKNIGASCAFWVNKPIFDWIKQTYSQQNISLVHQASSFLEGFLQVAHAEAPEMAVCIENRYLTMVVVAQGKLLFANRFYYQSPQDFVYYIMFALDELKLDPESISLTLYGEISPDSGIYTLLYKYIRNVQFGKRPPVISFNFDFETILSHRYFDLYSMFFCES